MDARFIQETLRRETEKEVKDNILKFWSDKSVDEKNGGFLGSIENDLSVDFEAPKGSVLNTRILWTYSKAYNIFKEEKYLKLAKRAYDFIKESLWDADYGGLFWMVDYRGNPLNTKKQIYAQAFGIYALSEYYIATKNPESLEYAIKLYRAIEQYSHDKENKGYFEACTREWEPTEDLQLGAGDMNEKKSMNTHLHILEAYTNLYRIWKDEDLKGQFEELIKITIDYIIDPETYHFKLFFDERWNSKSGVISYGHDIEGSWLLVEAAEVLGDKNLLKRTKEIACSMAQKVYEQGIDEAGAVMNEMLEDGSLDVDRIWWVQAEAVVGFMNAYEMTGKSHFLEAAYNTWNFIKEYVVDKKDGEWFWSVDKTGEPNNKYLKVDPWKCPYHNSRACFEVIERMTNK
ncbi:MAG TPA: N-acyl-D-glucosamine 2-epimerase [Epulopiscium sp.]|nr:N-acyl-D-glucosamine 2-epimerase [Candidatus Epulonipiscium sp.]